jgi:hypothetical protein
MLRQIAPGKFVRALRVFNADAATKPVLEMIDSAFPLDGGHIAWSGVPWATVPGK